MVTSNIFLLDIHPMRGLLHLYRAREVLLYEQSAFFYLLWLRPYTMSKFLDSIHAPWSMKSLALAPQIRSLD